MIHNLYEPYGRGGAENVVKNLCTALAELGNEVHLITLGRRKERDVSQGVIIERISPINIFSFLDIQKKSLLLRIPWHLIDMLNISSCIQIKSLLKIWKPDVVLTHNLKGVGYLIPLLIRKMGYRHIHYLHDVQLSRPSGLIFFGEKKHFHIFDILYEKICRRLFLSPSVVVSPSRWLMDHYTQRGFFPDSKKVVLPNPLPNNHHRNNKTETLQKRKRDVMVFSFVGQIEKSKGILFLVQTMKKISDDGWVLKIVGSGEAEKEVRVLVDHDSRFELYGRLSHSQLHEIYRNSDYCIVPSLCYENSPQVIAESFSYGVPVIASNIGGIPEMVRDGYNGFTFAPSNEKSFMEVIFFVLRHRQDREKLGRSALQTASQLFMDHYLERFFREVL